MRVVKVSLGERSYSILIGSGLLSRLGNECRKLNLGPRCAIITDNDVAPRFAMPAISSLQNAGLDAAVSAFPPGERSKNLKTVEACYNYLAGRRLERDSFLVALGGGVVGDRKSVV